MNYLFLFGWLGAIIIFALLEAATTALVSVWFIFGSVAGLIAALLGASFFVQFIVFAMVSVVFLLLLRPIAKKKVTPAIQPTNSDTLIGQTAIVTEPLDSIMGCGQVKVCGQVWSAKLEEDGELPAGAEVSVLRIEGVKVVVIPK